MPFANSRACTLIAMLCSSFLREYGNGRRERDLSRIYVHVLCAFTRSTCPLLIRAPTSNPPILILSLYTLTSTYCIHTVYTRTLAYIPRIIYIHFVGKNGCQPRLLTDKSRWSNNRVWIVSRIIIFESKRSLTTWGHSPVVNPVNLYS